MRDAPGLIFGDKIHSPEFKRLERGLRPFQRYGTDHDHGSGALRHDRAERGKTVTLRHFNVKGHHVRFQLARQLNGFVAVTRHAGDPDLRIPGEHTGERCSEKSRIINDKHINQSCLPGHGQIPPARAARRPEPEFPASCSYSGRRSSINSCDNVSGAAREESIPEAGRRRYAQKRIFRLIAAFAGTGDTLPRRCDPPHAPLTALNIFLFLRHSHDFDNTRIFGASPVLHGSTELSAAKRQLQVCPPVC